MLCYNVTILVVLKVVDTKILGLREIGFGELFRVSLAL